MNNTLFQNLSATLREIPACYQYFQELNILHSIALSDTCEVAIDEQLLDHLHSFKTHIPQMSPHLLKQFIRESNIKVIAENFKYFWKMGEVYILLREYLLAQCRLSAEERDPCL